MRHKEDWMILCPYYKGEEKQMIFCEGVQEGSAIHLAFDTNSNLRDYKNHYCRGCYNKCLLAGMQNRKWGYDEK